MSTIDANTVPNDGRSANLSRNSNSLPLNTLASEIEYSTVYAAQAASIVARYQYGLSLHELARRGVAAGEDANRKKLSSWIRQATELLLPVANCIRAYGLQAPVLTAANIAIASRDGGTRRLWGYIAPVTPATDQRQVPRAIWFHVTPDRLSVYARMELKSYHGKVQAPPFSGYECAINDGDATLIGCWASIASRARNLAVTEPNRIIGTLLDTIGELRQLERRFLKASCDERLQARREKSLPILSVLHKKLKRAVTSVNPGSHLATLLADIDAQWHSLCLFTDHSTLEMENGSLDKKLKSLTKRDPWIFTWHPSAPVWSGAMFSILESCVANGVNATSYIGWLLPQLEQDRDIILTEAHMPWNYPTAISTTA